MGNLIHLQEIHKQKSTTTSFNSGQIRQNLLCKIFPKEGCQRLLVPRSIWIDQKVEGEVFPSLVYRVVGPYNRPSRLLSYKKVLLRTEPS